MFDLCARERSAMTEGRCLELGPEACPVRHDEDDTALRREEPPDLAQQRAQSFRILDEMAHHDAIHAAFRQRQGSLVNERTHVRCVRRPCKNALLGRHEGDNALGFRPE